MTVIREQMEALKKSGRRIIAAYPPFPPLELLHSLGLTPIVLWGLKQHLPTVPESDRHLQSYTCSVARHLTEFVLGDTGEYLDGLYFYNACDTLRNMPELLVTGAEEKGRQLPLFRMHVPMVSPQQTDTAEYMRNEVRLLIDRLETTFSVSFSQDRFNESVALYREQRKLAIDAENRVAAGTISFADYASVSEANIFLTVEDQIERLKELLKKTTEPGVNGSRIALSGIILPHISIIETMEASGMRIVANDIASLYRSIAYTPERFTSAEDYYVDFFQNHFPCTTLLHTADRRLGALKDMIEQYDIQGMIFIGEKFCEHEYFEFPFLENQFKNQNVKSLMLEFSIDDFDNIEAYKTRIEAFAETLGS